MKRQRAEALPPALLVGHSAARGASVSMVGLERCRCPRGVAIRYLDAHAERLPAASDLVGSGKRRVRAIEIKDCLANQAQGKATRLLQRRAPPPVTSCL
jgi:hypothetical protein